MKLKRLPEDFQVEELTEFGLTGSGEFAFYRLTKRSLGTPEAIEAISRRWKLDRRQISIGGLKDRHAVSQQFLTIRRGPHRDLRQTNIELDYLGQTGRPFAPSDIVGNRFQIVLRSLERDSVDRVADTLSSIRRDGLPNYFDDQRFGSLGSSGEFVARPWIAGDYEKALWLALADANPLDRPCDREEKSLLREHWGDWPVCKQQMHGSIRSQIVNLLCDRPGDFRVALTCIRLEIRSLYLAAFQSYLWNRLLAAFLQQSCGIEDLETIEQKMGSLPCYSRLNEETRKLIHETELPLPSARIKLEVGPLQQLVEHSLGEVGLTLRGIRVKYPRDSFFPKGWRRAAFAVGGLTYQVADDELYRRRKKLTLRFDLPRGSYATILVKRIAATEAIACEPDAIESDRHEEETEASVE